MERDRLRPLMLVGTGSDVGKSVLSAAFCRIFLQDGYRPAPFKGQNMSLNSYATVDGGEIGRAQAVQAAACGLPAMVDMNPVLLKPTGAGTSQVVLLGKPVGTRSAMDYFGGGRAAMRTAVEEAFHRLARTYNPIVMEGAGSCCELNLQDGDLANLPLALWAGARALLVADIDRGGVFASAYGSIMLQRPEFRALIGGIIVNKFRGDLRLFEGGRAQLAAVCGVPVLGVVPWLEDLRIEAEDSVELEGVSHRSERGKVNVCVVELPCMSNFTDFDALSRTEGVHVYYAREAGALSGADVVILPGTKNTVGDLHWLWESGMAEGVINRCKAGVRVVGICGGYQILGETVSDPGGEESGGEARGLGLLPVRTVIGHEKRTEQVRFVFNSGGERWSEGWLAGYEIHQGVTEGTALFGDVAEGWLRLEDGREDGCLCGRALGTYVHGVLDHAETISWLLGREVRVSSKDDAYDRLADHVRAHVDMEAVYRELKIKSEK